MSEQDHERQYNPRAAVPDFERWFERAAASSRRARAAWPGRLDVTYGATALSTLDVFPAARPDAPIHVFLHGGYWRGRDKADFSYLADALVPHGVTTVVMNYDLCPQVTVPDIVAQTRAGLRWIHQHAADLGGDAARITASGHSAGAHLIAMALADDAGSARLPDGLLKAALLISGIYELAPVLGITVNEEIRLRAEMVDGVSPMRHSPQPAVPLDIVVGSDEPAAWIGQSRDFAEVCRRNGSPCTYREIAGCDHFSIMALLEGVDAPLTRMILAMAGVRP